MNDAPPLRIATITDHLAGHTSQVEALVAAIADQRRVDATPLRSRRRSPLRSHHLRRAILTLPGTDRLLPFMVEGDWRKPFDLVISASGSTITANVLLKRRNGARNLFSGMARGIAPGDMDCIIAHQANHVTTPQHVLGPVPVRRFGPPPGGFRQLAGSTVAVILGGEARGAGFAFDDGYCDRLFPRLAAIDGAVAGLRWIVVTSRRTPAACYPSIEGFARKAAHCDLVDFRVAGPGSMARAHAAQAVLVTEDSKTMVSEFLSNGYPTVVLAVPRPRPRSGDYLDSLKKSGNIPFLEPATLEAGTLESALRRALVEPGDIYARIRSTIASRIPELFDPVQS